MEGGLNVHVDVVQNIIRIRVDFVVLESRMRKWKGFWSFVQLGT